MVEFTCRVTVQYSSHHFTLLRGAALPGLTGDVVVTVTFTALQAVHLCEPSVSHLNPSRHKPVVQINMFKAWSKIFSWSKTQEKAHLPACTFHLHQYIHTYWVGHICLHWGPDWGYRCIPPHRVGCRSHQGLQGPDSWAGDRRGHMVYIDYLGDTSELEEGRHLKKECLQYVL